MYLGKVIECSQRQKFLCPKDGLIISGMEKKETGCWHIAEVSGTSSECVMETLCILIL